MAHDVWCGGLGAGHVRVVRVEVLNVVNTNVHLHNRVCIKVCTSLMALGWQELASCVVCGKLLQPCFWDLLCLYGVLPI